MQDAEQDINQYSNHLGNVVVTFSDNNGDKELLEELSDFTENNEVFQRMVYYPFGSGTDEKTKYQYNGKEFQDDFDLNLLDYGARFYDPVIGRFTSVDPLADKFAGWSPYNYVMNSPLNLIDPTGMGPESIHEDAEGNVIAEIDDGDHRIYRHDDINADLNIETKALALYEKRSKYGTGGGGEHQKFRSDMISYGKRIKEFFGTSLEGDQQQHSGENWYIYIWQGV